MSMWNLIQRYRAAMMIGRIYGIIDRLNRLRHRYPYNNVEKLMILTVMREATMTAYWLDINILDGQYGAESVEQWMKQAYPYHWVWYDSGIPGLLTGEAVSCRYN